MSTTSWDPVAAVKSKYPKIGMSDADIYQTLQDPTKFRAAFPEYHAVTDDEIKTNLTKFGMQRPDLSPPPGIPLPSHNLHEWEGPTNAESTYFPGERRMKDDMGMTLPHGMPGASEGHELAQGLADYISGSAGNVAHGTADIARGNIARGGHKIISGGMQAIAPALPLIAPAAPASTALGMGGGYVGGKLAHSVADWSGATPDQADFIGDLGSLAGGYAGVKAPAPMLRGAAKFIPNAAAVTSKLASPFGLPGRIARTAATSPMVTESLPRGLNSLADLISPPPPAPTSGQGRIPLWKKMEMDRDNSRIREFEPDSGSEGPRPNTWENEPQLQSPQPPLPYVLRNQAKAQAKAKLVDEVTNGQVARHDFDMQQPPNGVPASRQLPAQGGTSPTQLSPSSIPQPKLLPPSSTETLFHGTAAKNVPSIMRRGLDPNRMDPGYLDEEPQPFTFLGDHPDMARAFTPSGGGYNDTPVKGAIFKANVPSNKLVTDQGEFFRSPEVIPPSQLKLHEIVGSDDTPYTYSGPGESPIQLPQSTGPLPSEGHPFAPDTSRPLLALPKRASATTKSTPVTMYHGTPSSNIPSIHESGIKPEINFIEKGGYEAPMAFADKRSQSARGWGSQFDDGPQSVSIVQLEHPMKGLKTNINTKGDIANPNGFPVSSIRGVKTYAPREYSSEGAPAGDLVSNQYRNQGAGRHDIIPTPSRTGLSSDVEAYTSGQVPRPPSRAAELPIRNIPPGTQQPVISRGPNIGADAGPKYPNNPKFNSMRRSVSPFQPISDTTTSRISRDMYGDKAADDVQWDEAVDNLSEESAQSTKIPWSDVRGSQPTVDNSHLGLITKHPEQASNGDPMLWHDPETGHNIIIDGHHRATVQSSSGKPYLTGDIINPNNAPIHPEHGLLPTRPVPGQPLMRTNPVPYHSPNDPQPAMVNPRGATTGPSRMHRASDAPASRKKLLDDITAAERTGKK